MPRSWIYFCVSLIFILQCSTDQRQQPDLSSITLQSNVIRFDQELNRLDTLDFEQSFRAFWPKYQSFNEIYFKNILGINSDSIPLIASIVRNMVTHSSNQYLQGIVDSIYPDKEVFDPLLESFARLKHFLPEWEEPNIYAFISEFGIANFLFDDEGRDGLAIGLDFYLGNRIPYKQIDPSNPAFSEYITRTFNRDHLVTKAIRAIVSDIIQSPPQNQILDQMIYEGKILWSIEQLVPSAPDSIIHEYTREQMEWCNTNEFEIWALLIEENILYSNDFRKYNKLINPSPTSPGMPAESPGRTANFSGYKVVSSFMRQTDSDWPTLYQTDAKTILAQSRYKPKRS